MIARKPNKLRRRFSAHVLTQIQRAAPFDRQPRSRLETSRRRLRAEINVAANRQYADVQPADLRIVVQFVSAASDLVECVNVIDAVEDRAWLHCFDVG